MKEPKMTTEQIDVLKRVIVAKLGEAFDTVKILQNPVTGQSNHWRLNALEDAIKASYNLIMDLGEMMDLDEPDRVIPSDVNSAKDLIKAAHRILNRGM
jgi:hypothetical protein